MELGGQKILNIYDYTYALDAVKIGQPVKIVVDPIRLRPEKSEVLRLVSDNHLARERLGWQPQVSLEHGLDQTVRWISQNIGRYRPDKYQFLFL